MMRIFKLIAMSFLISSCMIKWDMNLIVNEDLSGSYSLTAAIDEELQIFALEMVQSSLGGLDSVLESVPEGYGKSFYSDKIYDGITIRNSFTNIQEFNNQILELKSNPNTALMLIPIEDISIEKESQSGQVIYKVFGEFAEIVESEVTDKGVDTPQIEYLYDLRLLVTLPGSMSLPIDINEGDNTVIFEPSGREVQTFEALSIVEDEHNRSLDWILIFSILGVGALAILIVRKNK